MKTGKKSKVISLQKEKELGNSSILRMLITTDSYLKLNDCAGKLYS